MSALTGCTAAIAIVSNGGYGPEAPFDALLLNGRIVRIPVIRRLTIKTS